jgi:hypothetical protein
MAIPAVWPRWRGRLPPTAERRPLSSGAGGCQRSALVDHRRRPADGRHRRAGAGPRGVSATMAPAVSWALSCSMHAMRSAATAARRTSPTSRTRMMEGWVAPVEATIAPKSVSAETMARPSARARSMMCRSDAPVASRSRTCTASCPASLSRPPIRGVRSSSTSKFTRESAADGRARRSRRPRTRAGCWMSARSRSGYSSRIWSKDQPAATGRTTVSSVMRITDAGPALEFLGIPIVTLVRAGWPTS